MDIKNFGPKELELLAKIKKNDLTSGLGMLKMLSFFPALLLSLAIASYCKTNDISIPFGSFLAQLVIWGSLGYSLYSLCYIVSLDNQFIRAMAERTGLKVVEEYTLIVESSGPQLYDEATKTYYQVRAHSEGVSIKEIKNV